jgi:N-acetyl-anhydromuramyl-L-alanine amidase AmpD
VILHSTRSGRRDFDHLQELTSTVGWFMNPDSQASAHWVISPTDAVRMVSDEYPSWATGWHNWTGYNIEVTQPLWNTPFEDGHYANLARVCADYVRQGIPIRRIEHLPYSSKEEGFVQHQDTEQGISVGKSDLGVMFDWSRFFAELRNEVQEENDMLKAIQKESGGAVYATDGIYKWGIPSDTLWTEMKAKNLIAPGLTKVSQFLFDRIKDRPATVGSGLSAAQLRAAVKEALREGTG